MKNLLNKSNIRKILLGLSVTVSSVYTVYSLAHNVYQAKAAAPCIITLFGKQYDVTSLQNSHSGGNVFVCGTDMTAVYQSQHGTDVTRMVQFMINTQTPTPTLTPTPTVVPSLTPTPSPIPTTTVSPSVTPTVSVTPTISPVDDDDDMDEDKNEDGDESEIEDDSDDSSDDESEHGDNDDVHESENSNGSAIRPSTNIEVHVNTSSEKED